MAGGESRYGAGEVLAVPAMRKDGKRISIEFTVLPIHDDAGTLLGIAAFLRDVTTKFEELRALRRELAELRVKSSREQRRRWPPSSQGCNLGLPPESKTGDLREVRECPNI